MEPVRLPTVSSDHMTEIRQALDVRAKIDEEAFDLLMRLLPYVQGADPGDVEEAQDIIKRRREADQRFTQLVFEASPL